MNKTGVGGARVLARLRAHLERRRTWRPTWPSARPSPRSRPTARAAWRAARSGCSPRPCTRRRRAPTPARSRPPMIVAAGADGTLVGHSERRAAGETDAQVAARVRAALDPGCVVILCVGESLEQREAGETEAWLTGQVRAALAGVRARRGRPRSRSPTSRSGPSAPAARRRPRSPRRRARTCGAVAGERLDGERAAGALRRQRHARTTPPELLAQPDIDGALVGGASLDPDAFAAHRRARRERA